MQQLQILLLFSTSFVGFYIIIFTWRKSLFVPDNRLLLKREAYPKYNVEPHPWKDVPQFVMYLRLTSGPRWEHEYKNVLIRTMKLFFPEEAAKLLVVLDNEKQEDHRFGDRIKSEWPYPKICYAEPSKINAYRGWGKARMFWDMMYPDRCTNVPFVGYVDSDTFFTTVVTPGLLFDKGKPIIVAKIGQVAYPCWAETTELFLGKKEAMQCMSTFPVMVKTDHIREMRAVLSKQKGKHFDFVFRDSAAYNNTRCICQFSIMCNYLWYYHREEYAWRLQMVPNGKWGGEQPLSSQVPLSYYEKVVKAEMTVPIPRSSIHLRYTTINGIVYDKREPPKVIVEEFLKEGLCYSLGFDICPEKCKRWNRTDLHDNLFSFETYQWVWDPRCKEQQTKHYQNVRQLLNYYISNGESIFGLNSTTNLCNLL